MTDILTLEQVEQVLLVVLSLGFVVVGLFVLFCFLLYLISFKVSSVQLWLVLCHILSLLCPHWDHMRLRESSNPAQEVGALKTALEYTSTISV